MLELNDLLMKVDVDPKHTLVMRHRPTELGLRRVLPWYAAERPELFNAYQRAQASQNAETALSRAKYLVSFIGCEPKRAHFAGLYRQNGYRHISSSEYWAIPENVELNKQGMHASSIRADQSLWFDLTPDDRLHDLQGRLIISWTGLERSWYRWAARNNFPIAAILDASCFAQDMPEWRQFVLSWQELGSLPTTWRSVLAEWRGIYLITDQSDGKAYVGSAYGKENLLGRWMGYAKTGHGGNRQLRKRDPNEFVFSILQRVSPDMAPEDVVKLEDSWKKRLQTRSLGLNSN